MAADWPASAKLSAVAPAGQSSASYTTSGDTTARAEVARRALEPRNAGVGWTALPVTYVGADPRDVSVSPVVCSTSGGLASALVVEFPRRAEVAIGSAG